MEKFDLENFPASESAKKMLSYVSDGFYDKSYVGKWIYQVMGMEYDKAREMAEELPYQFFPETATWGLMYHEIKWGLPIRLNLTYEERRRRIYEKRDYRPPMTPYRMESYLAAVTDLEIHVADCHDPGIYGYQPPHPNVFHVTLREHGTNSRVDYGSLEEMLSRLKQSHTAFTLEHRQEFEQGIKAYAGALTTEFVEYEIKARRVHRDIETQVHIRSGTISDSRISEEIRAGGKINRDETAAMRIGAASTADVLVTEEILSGGIKR